MLASAKALVSVPLLVAPVLKAKQLGEIEKLQVTYEVSERGAASRRDPWREGSWRGVASCRALLTRCYQPSVPSGITLPFSMPLCRMWQDPHLGDVKTTVYYTISTVKHVNSTAIQFLTDRGDTLSVWNGETFVQLAGSDVKYPVCKADVSCSALKVIVLSHNRYTTAPLPHRCRVAPLLLLAVSSLPRAALLSFFQSLPSAQPPYSAPTSPGQVADLTASDELVAEAHAALEGGNFTWRRLLAETQCLYQGANFVSLHERECSSLIDSTDLSSSPPIGGTSEQRQNCNRAEHCDVDFSHRPIECYDKCEELDTQAECELGKGKRPDASWWNGYWRERNAGTRGCQWLDQPNEVTGKKCDVDCTQRETLWDCIRHDKCQWVGQKSPLKFFCDNKCPVSRLPKHCPRANPAPALILHLYTSEVQAHH